jgi:hypothetical protein
MCDSNLQLEQTSYELPDSDNIKENVAYGTALHEVTVVQTEDNNAYIKTDHEQIQFLENQAYGTADHERIQTKSNKAYKDTLITKQNKAYASVDCERSCQMRKNQAYVPTDPERTHSSLPTATVGEDEHVSQSYEQISLNDDSAPPTQQLQQGSQCEGNDETYDYVTQ